LINLFDWQALGCLAIEGGVQLPESADLNRKEATFSFRPIGRFYGVFKEKFGTPRQAMMIKEARGVLILNKDHQFAQALSLLETFSHLWLIYVFDRDLDKAWHPMIMPPRIGKPNRVGVFASRSPHRPNPIGMSVARIDSITELEKHQFAIHLSGADLLDNTPVLDIKPYLPYADSVVEANTGWVDPQIVKYPVIISEEVEQFIASSSHLLQPDFRSLLLSVVELDPRPTTLRRRAPIESLRSEGKKFAFRFLGFNIRCLIHNHHIEVRSIEAMERRAQKVRRF